LKPCCFFGGILLCLWFGFVEACFAVSEEPVNIWTTCLNEVVSAWTNVVGYGLPGSDLVIGLGEGIWLWFWVWVFGEGSEMGLGEGIWLWLWVWDFGEGSEVRDDFCSSWYLIDDVESMEKGDKRKREENV